MEAIKETLPGMVVKRAFAPGRLRHQWMAAAYERLVPVARICRSQEPQRSGPEAWKEAVWAR